jgi:hypothetical protein
MVTDLPDVMETWDWEENFGIEPTELHATTTTVVGWVCRGHQDKDHLHRYRRSVKDRVTDPFR